MERKDTAAGTWRGRVLRTVIGGGISVCAGVLLLFLAACAVSAGALGEELAPHVAVAACVVGGYIGGRVSSRGAGERSIVGGAATGAVFFLFLLVAGAAFCGGDGWETDGAAAILVGCLCGGALSGLGGRRGKRRKKRR